jgi:hypothetical protein
LALELLLCYCIGIGIKGTSTTYDQEYKLEIDIIGDLSHNIERLSAMNLSTLELELEI